MSEASASVVVASRDRPVRLRWLLNALEDQLRADGLEVIVAHDSAEPATSELLSTHPLAATGALREILFPARSSSPAAMRNAGWRAARAPLVLFTDDDCRPAPDWVARALDAFAGHPGAILQGRTRPDPDERSTLIGAPWPHTLDVTPPDVWAPTCNIAYPRELLERTGGFDERFPGAAGEDTDLAMRASELGAALVAVPEMLTHHAVSGGSLASRLRSLGRWQAVPAVVGRHPALRDHITARLFWKAEHAGLLAAAAGLAIARRRPAAVALALPWLRLSMRHNGFRPRGLVRSATELPGHALIDATEIAVMVRGSVRHGTLLL